MKNYKRLLSVVALIAIMATVFAPQTQARKKRNAKKEAIEDLLREGNERYEAGDYEQAVALYEQVQKKGDIRATHNLAVCYAEGKGVDHLVHIHMHAAKHQGLKYYCR